MAPDILERIPSVLNVGVMDFTRSVVAADGDVLHIDWHPPGQGDPEAAWTLARLTGDSAMAHCSVSISIGPTQKP